MTPKKRKAQWHLCPVQVSSRLQAPNNHGRGRGCSIQGKCQTGGHTIQRTCTRISPARAAPPRPTPPHPTPPHPTPPHNQQKKLYSLLGWFEGLESTRKIHTSRMGRVSHGLATGDIRKRTQQITLFLTALTRLQFFFSPPQKSWISFFENPQKMRADT